jgi:methylase of polypeptide subunit release factors
MLTKKQKKQITLQIKAHIHKRYEVDIVLTEGHVLKKFAVHPNVLRPEIMTSMYLGRWLFFNNGIYKGRKVLDMGCGTGMLGIIMSLNGARETVFSDIDNDAIKNTKENVRRFGLKNSKVIAGDLFESIKGKFDVIVFNHPFFGDVSDKYENKSMIMSGGLLNRFLAEANHISPAMAQ